MAAVGERQSGGQRAYGQRVYMEVAESICQRIIRGELSALERVPTETELAEQMGVNRLTVSRGYRVLQERGIITQRRGQGSFVARNAEQILGLSPRRRLRNVACVFAAASLSHILAVSRFISLDLLFGISKRFEGLSVNICYLPISEPQQVSQELISRFDAFFLLGFSGAVDRLVSLAHQAGRPCLSMFGDGEIAGVPRVSYDRAQAVRLALDHMVQRGYRRIGFGGSLDGGAPGTESMKLDAYRRFMAERGLEFDPAWIMECGRGPGQAYRAAAAYASSSGKRMPEAFFIDTDYKALEVMQAFSAAGLDVPHQVAICGYDDIPDSAAIQPALTTVRTPRQEIGYQVADLLLSWLPGEASPEDRLLTATLVIRQTTPHKKK